MLYGTAEAVPYKDSVVAAQAEACATNHYQNAPQLHALARTLEKMALPAVRRRAQAKIRIAPELIWRSLR